MNPNPQDPEMVRFQQKLMLEGDTKLRKEVARRIMETCLEKCVNLKKIDDGEDATPEEMECTNNCAKKYWRAHKIVGLTMKNMNQV